MSSTIIGYLIVRTVTDSHGTRKEWFDYLLGTWRPSSIPPQLLSRVAVDTVVKEKPWASGGDVIPVTVTWP